MAKRHLEQYDKNGNLLDIYLNEDEVMVDGQTLAEKISDMQDEIDQAGQGDGTVTGVKVGNTPYNPDSQGVVDLSTPFAGKVDKDHNKELIPSTDLAKLQNLPTADQLTQQLGQKANDADVVKSISVNGTAQTKDTNGNVNIEVEGGGAVESVTINGTNHEPNSQGIVDLGTIHDGEDGITPHIGQDGYWYIGTTNTGVKAQGERGNDGVASADECVVVNNLDGEPADLEEGQVAVLGANQGKELADRIDNAIESIGHITITKDGDTFKMKVRTSASEPVISIETMMEGFGEVEQNSSKVKQILVKGWNINGPVTLISNNGAFLLKTESGSSFLDTVTLNPMNSGTLRSLISVQFSPVIMGINNAIITASYQNISSFVSLNGTCVAEAEPSVEITTLSDNVYSSQAGEQSVAYVRIQGYNLSSPLTLAAAISNSSSVVSLNKNTLTAQEAENGEVITVFYTPASGVTFETIVLSVTGTGISENEEIAVGIVAAPAADDTITVDGMLFNVLTAATKSTRGTVEICHTSGKEPGSTARSNYRGDFEIPSEISYYMYNYDVTGIRKRAFYYSYITSLKIPASITSIGDFAVTSTTTITSFEFAEGCVAVPGLRMFNACTEIGAANFPNTTPSIGNYAFSGATGLAKVRIGSSRSCVLTAIGQYAFYGCNNIIEVVCWATSPPAIDGTASNFMPDAARTTAVLKVPSESVSAYQAADIWKTFGSIVAIDE